MKKLSSFLLVICTVNLVSAQQKNMLAAKQLVAKMTLDEKIHLLVGKGMKIPGMNFGVGPVIGQTKDKVDGAAGTTHAVSRLGIASAVLADGPAGLRINPIRDNEPGKTFYCTAFPVATLLASSWDTTVVQEVGKAMGKEVKEYGVDILLVPGLNIQRNPLGGRNFEYYSEDPVVAGNITAAMVNGIESNGVGTSIKHFAVNNQETNRNLVNINIGERALREIYLRGFEIAVKKSQPWTVMSSYNKLNGTYTSEEYKLLTTILRKEWGFKGFVMTDWFGGSDAVAQMKAGNDLLMPGTSMQIKAIADAVANGSLNEKIIDENATRVLNILLASPSFNNYKFSNQPDLKANALVARNAAAAGMVLLKNVSNSLPINNQLKKMAVFGNTSYDYITGGTGSGDVNEAYSISLEQGLSSINKTIDAGLKNVYIQYINDVKSKRPKKNFFEEFLNPSPPIPELDLELAAIQSSVAANEIALVTIGRNAGEGRDRKTENDFNLSATEMALIKNVSTAFHAAHKKVIVLLNVGGVIETSSWSNEVDAILLSWQGGQEGCNAIADLLSGKINPSGKLAVSFPINYEDDASAKNFPGRNTSDQEVKGLGGFSTGFPSEVNYEEGIYVGYRYFNTFHKKTAYPFGFGLSYTNFKYSNLIVSSPDFNGQITASVNVSNIGKVAGKEIVQLYVAAPSKKMSKPLQELKAFAKTNLLKPGQQQNIRFVINAKELASFDTKFSSWIAEAGNYTIKIGASSDEILQQANFKLSKELLVEKCNKVLQPQISITEMKN